YKAADAGVKIRLNVRAMCSMIPKKHKNIEIIGIVDYYLEHSRIFIFCNDDDPLYFIGSADFMTRNLDHRVEVLSPIYDKTLQIVIKNIFECSWKDNIKARHIQEDAINQLRTNSSPPFRSQFEMYHQMYQYLPPIE
ncbi:MAG: RNA degradosome polyphosphate kinase, partial [Bacteroidales bacterium]|nr:RNA degradosome polyphosphate kinase [Bacteroidales bacterium]